MPMYGRNHLKIVIILQLKKEKPLLSYWLLCALYSEPLLGNTQSPVLAFCFSPSTLFTHLGMLSAPFVSINNYVQRSSTYIFLVQIYPEGYVIYRAFLFNCLSGNLIMYMFKINLLISAQSPSKSHSLKVAQPRN